VHAAALPVVYPKVPVFMVKPPPLALDVHGRPSPLALDVHGEPPPLALDVHGEPPPLALDVHGKPSPLPWMFMVNPLPRVYWQYVLFSSNPWP
jgi:hypothetical protein